MASRISATDKQWQKWSQQNPYYGVLLVDSDKMADPAIEAAFFESGEKAIANTLERVDRHFGGFNAREAALDFGCGVGRLVGPLAKRFKEVVGVDVAPQMIEVAGRNTAQHKNISFVNTLAPLMTAGRQFDFVHTALVLQHIRIWQGMPIIEQLLTLTKPGGFFAMQFTYGDKRPLRKALNWARYRIAPLHYSYNLARGRQWNEPITEMNEYDLHKILLMMTRDFGSDGVLALPLDENRHASITLIGRRGL